VDLVAVSVQPDPHDRQLERASHTG
jgi:hypothetical protein